MNDVAKPTVSLQSKLVKSSVISSIGAGILALIILLGISFYQTMSIHDEIMDEVSDMLLVTDVTAVTDHQLDEISSEFKIQYQLVFENKSLTHSEKYDSISELLENQNKFGKDGYHYIWYKKKLWRSYVQHENDLKSYVIQPLTYRFKDLLNTFAVYFAILLLVWFIQWLFIHFTIRRQFKSFNLLAKKIAEKNADDLKPIDVDAIEFTELQPMILQLNNMLKRLEKALLAEQRFTSDASHELRSPLSAIQMRLQLLKRKYESNELLQSDLAQIQKDVGRGALILENLLLLARLDPENINALPKSRVDINALIKEVVASLEPFIQEKNIKLTFEFDDRVHSFANNELIFTCIRNLVDNAVRYNLIDGNIEISTKRSINQNEIVIRNNGDELSDEVLERLGERFYRTLGTNTVGSGLGISICKKIIDLHQGSIEFSKNSGSGLRVIILLPK
jgi:two-component system, OmpR family, sensor histidine kinase QseC